MRAVPSVNATGSPDAVSSGDGWPHPVGAVEILPADAVRTMYDTWCAARLDGMGGSDISAALGLDGFESQYGLWLTKTGRRPPIPDTGRMERGRYLEPALAQFFADKTGIALRRTGTWVVDGAEWMLCNPDRLTSDGGGVEIKAPDTDDWGNLWRHGPAIHAVIQAMWCMAVLGLRHWYVVADGADGLRWWRVDRDDMVIEWMVSQVEWWWFTHVVHDQPPDVDGSDATTDAIKQAMPIRPLAEGVQMPGAVLLNRRRRELKNEIKVREQELKVIENKFKAALMSAVTAYDGTTPVLSWDYIAGGTRRLGDPKK